MISPWSHFGRVAARSIERVALAASLAATAAAVAAGPPAALVLAALVPFYFLLARRWQSEGPVHLAQASLVGAYLLWRGGGGLPGWVDASLLLLFCFLDLGAAEVAERLGEGVTARGLRRGAMVLPMVPLLTALAGGAADPVQLFVLLTAAAFYALLAYDQGWKPAGYAAGLLFNGFLWALWSTNGWRLADHPPFFLVPVGFSLILLAEANRQELGRQGTNALRSAGLMVVYLSVAVPLWQTQSFGAWLALLLFSLLGIFAGIGLRAQSFLWLGLCGFCFSLLYQLGRVSLEHALARWAIMLGLGIVLILFVALTEKQRLLGRVRAAYEEVRAWE